MNLPRPTRPTMSDLEVQGWTPETVATQAFAQPSNLLLDQIKIINRYHGERARCMDSRASRLPATCHKKVGQVGRIRRNHCAATIVAVQPVDSGLGNVQPKVGRPHCHPAATVDF